MKILGIDVKLDSYGKSHPWEVVLLDSVSDEKISYHVRLPEDKKYISLPYDHRYGDLTQSGISFQELVRSITEKCSTDGDVKVLMADWHFGSALERSLTWNGCLTVAIKVDDYDPDPVFDNRVYAEEEAKRVLKEISS